MRKIDILDVGNLQTIIENKEPVLLVFRIKHEDIIDQNISSMLERLYFLIDDIEYVKQFKSSIAIMVDGYDDDARELFAIPEVRSYFALLTKEWPHWIWFASRDLEVIPLLMALHVELVIESNTQIYIKDPIDAICLIENWLNRGIPLYDAYNISQEEMASQCKSFADEFNKLL